MVFLVFLLTKLVDKLGKFAIHPVLGGSRRDNHCQRESFIGGLPFTHVCATSGGCECGFGLLGEVDELFELHRVKDERIVSCCIGHEWRGLLFCSDRRRSFCRFRGCCCRFGHVENEFEKMSTILFGCV